MKINKNANNWFFGGILLVFLALLFPVLLVILTNSKWSVIEISRLGSIGDFLGGSTVGLLSLSSIFFVIHTISMQGKELALQRKELELTRNELILTREEFGISNYTARLQQIENTIFNMLELNSNITRNFLYTDKDGSSFQGDSAFKALIKDFNIHFYGRLHHDNSTTESRPVNINEMSSEQSLNFYNGYMSTLIDKDFSMKQNYFDYWFDNFFKSIKNKNLINQYIENNNQILQFIIQNIINADDESKHKLFTNSKNKNMVVADRDFYLSILKSQWSFYQKDMIFISILHSKYSKFKKNVLKSDILDIKEDLIRISSNVETERRHIKLYENLIRSENP
ncbi:hypothetical protein [Exiguobacterium acetylicum]|uniref:hypothetical protein n=1 Tax=Exiguobacterium acetylicum TaxID=41170 RepID=UPI001EE2D145|nr:hypothetical protein [Exiguobacterium acetylicum]UKS57753.1 hypothetical protein K6T22_16845 [Exiguobacterium acetylicum]